VLGLGALLSLLAAATASAAFVAPSFIRQWDAGPTLFTFNVAYVATDPFGDVYVTRTAGGGNSRIEKYHHDGTPVPGQWGNLVPSPDPAIATDAQGHVFIGAGLKLLEFTRTGAPLGTYTPQNFVGDALAIDAAGNIYSNGTDAAGHPAVNEYSQSGASLDLIHSAQFPGTPNSCCAPQGFLGLTVDPAGNVYGSGVSTTDRFLAKFPPSLAGNPSYLDDCSATANPSPCFGGFGIAFANADVSSTSGEQPTVFSAGGYVRKVGSFYDVGVFSTDGPAPHILGSYQEAPVPGGYFTNVAQVAASPCHNAVYVIVNVFGNPNNTLSGWAVQEFDTHAAPPPCATGFTSDVSGFSKQYKLVVPGGTLPCTPCASVLPDGAFISSAGAGTAKKKGKKKRKKRPAAGVNIAYTSSAAADTTFMFTKLGGHKGKGKKRKAQALGGFVYAAHAGTNQFNFSGVLRPGVMLKPGAYRVTVSAGQNQASFKLIVPKRGR
jgi:hypothetical protein